MITIGKSLVLTILNLLKLLLVSHLGVELLVLVDVLFFLDLGLVGDTGDALLVLFLELGELLLIGSLGSLALGGTAGLNGSGTTRIVELQSSIDATKNDRVLTKAERDEAINKYKAQMEKAKQVESQNKGQINSLT